VVDLVEKVYLYLILAALVPNLISKKWCWWPFWIEQPVLLIRLTPAYGSHLDSRVKVKFNVHIIPESSSSWLI